MQETVVHSSEEIDVILAKYKMLVYRLAYSKTGNRFDADDIFQEVFMRFIRSAPVFQSDEHAKAWFLKVTCNCTKNYFLSSWKKRVVLTEDMDDMRKLDSMEAETDFGIYDAVLKLPPKFRAVIHLFYAVYIAEFTAGTNYYYIEAREGITKCEFVEFVTNLIENVNAN